MELMPGSRPSSKEEEIWDGWSCFGRAGQAVADTGLGVNPSKQSFTWAGDRLQEQALAQWKPEPEVGGGKGQ